MKKSPIASRFRWLAATTALAVLAGCAFPHILNSTPVPGKGTYGDLNAQPLQPGSASPAASATPSAPDPAPSAAATPAGASEPISVPNRQPANVPTSRASKSPLPGETQPADT